MEGRTEGHVAGIGDFNRDGTSDILWRYDNGFIGIWQMHDGHINAGIAVTTAGGGTQIAEVGDYNSDGTDDILWRDNNGSVGLWTMNAGQIQASTTLGSLTSDWHIIG